MTCATSKVSNTGNLEAAKVSQLLGSKSACTTVAPAESSGALAGEKVAQLYVHDCVASRVRPVRELKGFQKAGGSHACEHPDGCV